MPQGHRISGGNTKPINGKDIVHPLACEGSEWMGALLTMVDSLDTLWIMKLDAEFDEARKWISSYLEFNSTDPHINVFETTIRLLGGLLSAYTLSKDRMFLGKATILGDILLGAFDGMSAFPSMDINFSTGKGNPNSFEELCLAEVATIQLEFNELSRLTKNPIYAHTAAQVYKRLHELPKMNGLLPIGIDRETGNSVSSRITIGARGDSYYEYLLKVWVQTGKVLDYLRTDYIEAIEGIKSRLIQYSKPNRLLFIGEIDADGTFLPRMDHLVCFLPGTLAYGILHNMTRAHLELAESLMRTCYEMYSQTATLLSPENILFDVSNKSTKDFWPASTENILRPETMESLYYLYTITKNPKYQLWGRTILDAFERYSKWHAGGYTGKVDVSTPDSERIDKMESFWLAETLKYAYLLFDEDASSRFPLNKWVFNTEAHPLPVVSDPKSLLSAVYAQLGDV
ncbi:hypothetical protein T265_03386 [Opisthorchis viverrini]|uniref:alpha-1,2-Mannosidase n=2 Tax=Opisthorchis viverrini TaxID=6198 RepID=A0A074ZSN3_OPIVI|nr:hypothetical protein T265_03386 [Opisthorchis viverrini]KER30121.1 hypothetical protein T265_03386 [Opisthorchis viverrini]